MAQVSDDGWTNARELDLELGVVVLHEFGQEVGAGDDQIRLRVLQHCLERRKEALHIADEQQTRVVSERSLQRGNSLVFALYVVRLEASNDLVRIH